MKLRFIEKPAAVITALGVLLATGAGAFTAQPAAGAATVGFADPAFQRVWNRTDALVQSGKVKRSWYWGPQANTEAIMEDYAEGPGGKHLVQYFDKSRMEINNPGGDKNNPFYVTNGLLVKELISGYMQTGDNKFVLRWPAEIPIAGDEGPIESSAPTYASFREAIERKATPDNSGKPIIATIGWNGTIDLVHGGAPYGSYDRHNVKNSFFEGLTSHNIPDVFWNFLSVPGRVIVDGKETTAPLNTPYFYATGLPISEAYWTSVMIGGKSADVLIQAYERRVLTYVPSNPEGFKVEMGNVGQHYYDWRYNDAGASAAVEGMCEVKPVLGFGKVYTENVLVRINLGCAESGETRHTIARQSFQRGEMISVTRFDFYSGRNYEDVFVLYRDGKAATTSFLPPFSGPEPANQPPAPLLPAGLSVPTGNFGLVWRINLQKSLDELGWATGPAEVFPYDEKTKTGGGVAQYFFGGAMIYPNLNVKKIYVLHNNGTYAYVNQGPHVRMTDTNHWSVYDDRFQQ